MTITVIPTLTITIVCQLLSTCWVCISYCRCTLVVCNDVIDCVNSELSLMNDLSAAAVIQRAFIRFDSVFHSGCHFIHRVSKTDPYDILSTFPEQAGYGVGNFWRRQSWRYSLLVMQKDWIRSRTTCVVAIATVASLQNSASVGLPRKFDSRNSYVSLFSITSLKCSNGNIIWHTQF